MLVTINGFMARTASIPAGVIQIRQLLSSLLALAWLPSVWLQVSL